MKLLKTHFTTIMTFALLNCTFGQQPYKLVDDSNKWYEYGQFGGFYPYPPQYVHLFYFFNGDTVINGITYKQLFANRRDTTYYNQIDTTQPPQISSLQNFYGYVAAFRQDSLKVYFIMKDSTTENLYCDFDISIGDTINYYYNWNNNKVDSITSIPFGSGTRKRYIMDNGNSFYEGIGCSYGLFHDWSIGIEGGVYLVCFEQAGITQNVYDLWGTPPPCPLPTPSIGNCSAFYDLFPDTIPHRYYAINYSSGTSPLSYFWNWGDGGTDTIPFPSHTYNAAGNYTISLTIGDTTGCTDTYSNYYSIMKTSSTIVEVNVIPPPLNTGVIKNSVNISLLVFPNPASDYLKLELPAQISKADFKIFSTLGQLEFSSVVTNQNLNLDISELTSGIYILEVRTNNTIIRQRFIKE